MTAQNLVANFSLIDYIMFIGLLIVSSLIGVYFGWKDRKSTDNKNFLTGGRNLAVFPVAMSLSASFMSTNTILGVPAEIYSLVGERKGKPKAKSFVLFFLTLFRARNTRFTCSAFVLPCFWRQKSSCPSITTWS